MGLSKAASIWMWKKSWPGKFLFFLDWLITGMGVHSTLLPISFLLYGLGLRSWRLKLWTVVFSAELFKMKTLLLITPQVRLPSWHSDVLFLHWKVQKAPLKIFRELYYPFWCNSRSSLLHTVLFPGLLLPPEVITTGVTCPYRPLALHVFTYAQKVWRVFSVCSAFLHFHI